MCGRLVALVERGAGLSAAAPHAARCSAAAGPLISSMRVCGIVGYVGRRPVRELLLAGLTKLEYRGYDSAGISVIANERIEAVRAVGNLSALRAKLDATAPVADPGGGGPAVALAARPRRPGSATRAGRPMGA